MWFATPAHTPENASHCVPRLRYAHHCNGLATFQATRNFKLKNNCSLFICCAQDDFELFHAVPLNGKVKLAMNHSQATGSNGPDDAEPVTETFTAN